MISCFKVLTNFPDVPLVGPPPSLGEPKQGPPLLREFCQCWIRGGQVWLCSSFFLLLIIVFIVAVCDFLGGQGKEVRGFNLADGPCQLVPLVVRVLEIHRCAVPGGEGRLHLVDIHVCVFHCGLVRHLEQSQGSGGRQSEVTLITPPTSELFSSESHTKFFPSLPSGYRGSNSRPCARKAGAVALSYIPSPRMLSSQTYCLKLPFFLCLKQSGEAEESGPNFLFHSQC